MLNRKLLVMLIVTVGVLSLGFLGCGGGSGGDGSGISLPNLKYSVNGFIQKGPFISGTSITIQELDEELNPKGMSYQTTAIDDFGAFSIGSQIQSSYIEVIASGFYYDEVIGSLSPANLTLRTISDLSVSENVNVNILTTLSKDRIYYLVNNSGMQLLDAKEQAESEVLTTFHISGDAYLDFDKMDISQKGVSNSILLAISSVLQNTNTVAELSELISKISLDLREDGLVNDSALINEIINNAETLNPDKVISNLADRFGALGQITIIPDFTGYIGPMKCAGLNQDIWYEDADNDGYGDTSNYVCSKLQPVGYVSNNADCNGNDYNISPESIEICNDYQDNDCDQLFDCGDTDCSNNASCSADSYNSLGMGFKLISSGVFAMGSPLEEIGLRIHETPQHIVTISNDFYIQETEVTQSQWTAMMESNPSYFSLCGNDCPVEMISWDDVQNFILALNSMGEGIYRLPSEAEWEYAARAGSTTAFANGVSAVEDCSFESNLDRIGWYCGNSGNRTHRVAQKAANAWGLYDMHGNVNEWCQDWFGDYKSTAVVDPTGPMIGDSKVRRGGGWIGNSRRCRAASRYGNGPEDRYNFFGFRLIKEP